jgi:hypothetical protein
LRKWRLKAREKRRMQPHARQNAPPRKIFADDVVVVRPDDVISAFRSWNDLQRETSGDHPLVSGSKIFLTSRLAAREAC